MVIKMIDFDFIAPTRIIFGHKAEDKIGAVLAEYGFKKVLLVYGFSVKRTGLYEKIITLLDKDGIAHVELSEVRANPCRSKVLEGLSLAKKEKVDCLLALGGGSIIDTAKSIGVGYYYEGDPFDFNLHTALPKKSLPVGVISTMASSGSESSDSCVIQDDGTHVKQGFNSPIVRPLFAIEDPELTYTVPAYQTAAGVADIMMHSLERYFGPSDPNQLADEFALDLIKNAMKAGRAVLKDPRDYGARASLMLDSSLSHDGLTSIGKAYKFVIHPLEHVLSGYRPEIVHGAGVALLYPAWAQRVYKKDPHKFAHLAKALFKIKGTNDEELAIMGIRSMRDFFVSIGLPSSLNEVGINQEDLPNLVSLASGNGTHGVGCYPQVLDVQDIEAIYASLVR